MKKILLATMAVLAMAGCSQNEDAVVVNNDPVEINLNGGIEAMVVSRAAVNKGEALSGIQFVRVNGESIGELTDLSAVAITGSMAATTGIITFAPKQYYPSDGTTNANILAFYPAATSIAAGVATMTIDGTNDVMYTDVVSGSKGTPITSSLSFKHKLTQFKFAIKRDATTTDAEIANVKVAIKDANSVFKMDLKNGNLSEWGTPISTITPILAGTTGQSESAGFMLQPDLAKLSLIVSATGYGEKTIDITGTDNGIFEVGKAYTITLTFKGTEITPSGAIAEWTPGTAGSADVQ